MNLTEAYFNPARGVGIPEIDAAYVQLERNGFAVNTEYLNSQAAIARDDEDLQLRTLRVEAKNCFPAGTDDADIDSTWSSPTKLKRLLHSDLGLEPSPIWTKGEVALWKGEVKTDAVAIKYLRSTNPQLRPMLDGLLNLKRIRSSLKYLEKIPGFVQSDGLIHPIYGAGDDDDESSGTNSGRTVMKNPEGQQIPNGKDKDPYCIRKGFVAPPGQVLVVRDYSAMEAVLLHAICLALFDDNSLATANTPTFHNENARSVFGDILKWKHPQTGRLLSDYSLEDYETDSYLKDRRRDAKTVFYGLQFCKSVKGFGWTLLDASGSPIGERIAGDIVRGFLEVRTGISKFQDFVSSELRSFKPGSPGYRKRVTPGVPDFVGRYRNVLDLLSEYISSGSCDWRFRKAWRQCCNHPEQAGGANIKGAAIVHSFRKGIVLQNDIHDELVARCLPEESEEVDAKLKWCMEETFPLPAGVKLNTKGSIAKTWYDAK